MEEESQETENTKPQASTNQSLSLVSTTLTFGIEIQAPLVFLARIGRNAQIAIVVAIS